MGGVLGKGTGVETNQPEAERAGGGASSIAASTGGVPS